MISRLIIAFISAIMIIGALVSGLLFTTQGARALLRWASRRYAAPFINTVREIRGILFTGVTLRGVTLSGLRMLPPTSVVRIDEATLSPLPSWHRHGPAWTLRGLQAQGTPWAREITIERAQGSIARGVVAQELRAVGVQRLPAGSVLEIQRVEVGWPMAWSRVRTIDNGRLWIEQADPIVFFVSRNGNETEIKISANAVDVQKIIGLFPKLYRAATVKGTVNNLTLMVKAAGPEWTVTGNGQIAQASWRTTTLANSAAKINLRIQHFHPPIRMTGTVDLWGGTLTAKRTRITLQPSKFIFNGDPLKPAFDSQGRSTVGRTVINIHLQGTKDAPELQLTSQPPLPKETLLLMLATGKTWRATRETFAQGTVSTMLVTDVVDYLFFGGFGNRLARRFGISEFGLTQNVERNLVGAQATFQDRLMFDVMIDPTAVHHTNNPSVSGSPAPQQQLPPYQVGAEYQATENTSIRVEGERSAAPSRPGTTALGEESSASSSVDNSVVLKLKRQF